MPRALPRAQWLRDLDWSESHHQRREQEGARTRLLALPGELSQQELARLHLTAGIRQAEAEGVHLRSHCARRLPWWSLRDVAVSQAFLTYMASDVPRMALNSARAVSTNAVHRIWWRSKPTSAEAVARVLTTRTSLWRLAGELVGRHYGGGVMKLEPTAAAMLPIVNMAVGDGTTIAAPSPAEADRILLRDGLGLTGQEVALLSQAAAMLRSSRPGRRLE